MADTFHIPSLAAGNDGAAPRRALILAGGGMRVAYQAGVLKALQLAGLTFCHGDGTSGGIMNLAMLLSGLTPDDMCRRWVMRTALCAKCFHIWESIPPASAPPGA